uniref:chitobiase/beta-hexosaminidase C-terminal domain-containing protein n=1 Tax=Natronospira sp. TaxID=2024970 RepID=UPI003873C01D
DEDAFGAPDDESLDYALGWPSDPGIQSDSRSIDDFAGLEGGGTWVVRLWGTWDGQDPAGSLQSGSLIEIEGSAMNLAFSPDGGSFIAGEPVDVAISSADSDATIYYTLDGSDPDSGSDSIDSGETVTVSGGVDDVVVLQAFAETNEGDTPIQGREYAFFSEVGIVDGDGQAITDQRVDAGQGVAFSPDGGSGDYAVSAAANSFPDSDVEGELSEENGEWTFTVTPEGAFAGSYEVTVTDAETGSSSSFLVNVDLLVEADFDLLLEADEPRELRVLGAVPDYALSLSVQDTDGNDSTVAELDPADVTSVDDAEAGNPATTLASSTVSSSEDFQVEVHDSGGSYETVTADGFSTAPSRHYAGWVSSEFGDDLVGARVKTADEVGPEGQERRYRTETDDDGVFHLITPVPDDGEHDLAVVTDGFAMANVAGADCVGSEPQCDVVLSAAGEIRGEISGLLEDETVALYLEDSASGDQFGPMEVTADGSGSDAFALPADTTRAYTILLSGTGYEPLEVDDGGSDFVFSGDQEVIEGVTLEPQPTTPEVLSVSVVDSEREVLVVAVELSPADRAGSVSLDWGEEDEALEETTDAVSYDAGAEPVTVEVEISGLDCNSSYDFRATAVNDQGMSHAGELGQGETAGCPSSGSSGCSLASSDDGKPDPLLPLIGLLALLGMVVVRRRV